MVLWQERCEKAEKQVRELSASASASASVALGDLGDEKQSDWRARAVEGQAKVEELEAQLGVLESLVRVQAQTADEKNDALKARWDILHAKHQQLVLQQQQQQQQQEQEQEGQEEGYGDEVRALELSLADKEAELRKLYAWREEKEEQEKEKQQQHGQHGQHGHEITSQQTATATATAAEFSKLQADNSRVRAKVATLTIELAEATAALEQAQEQAQELGKIKTNSNHSITQGTQWESMYMDVREEKRELEAQAKVSVSANQSVN